MFLRLSRSTVSRGLVILGTDTLGLEILCRVLATIVLAFCPSCRHRPRVLPCDVLPRKTYSLPVIEKTGATYTDGHQSLRAVVWRLPGDQTPVHATLHAWTEGLGAFALGRPGGTVAGADSSSRILSETAARHPDVDVTIDSSLDVDRRRYRSEARRERLSAVISIFSIAVLVTGAQSPDTLTEWRRMALSWRLPDTMRFATGIQCTRIEHRSPLKAAGSAPDAPPGGEKPCRARARSPPGDTS